MSTKQQMMGTRIVAAWIIATWIALSLPAAAQAVYTFADWAADHGYSPGDAMPGTVEADRSSPDIDDLAGIGDYNWTATPTRTLYLESNEISSIESGAFSGLTSLETLFLYGNQITSIESGAFSGLSNLTGLGLRNNPLSSIESGAFSGLTNLGRLYLSENTLLTELNLSEAAFSSLVRLDVRGNTNITSVSLKNAVLNQAALAALLDGGDGTDTRYLGIGDLPGITALDLSGVDFANISDLAPLYAMDDLTDLWLVDVLNLDATQLDLMLNELTTIEGTDFEGILYMTDADFNGLNMAGGGRLAIWDDEPGHHVQIVPIPEPTTLALLAIASLGLLPWLRRRTHA